MPRNGAAMLLAGLLLAGGKAGAAGPPPLDTTRDLLRYCEGTAIDDTVQQDQTFCDGFIAGTGLLYLELVRAGVVRPWACAEPVPDLATVRETFVRWARSNPHFLDAKPIDGFWRDGGRLSVREMTTRTARGAEAMRRSWTLAAAMALPLLAGACAVDRTTGERTGTAAAAGAASGAVIGLLRGNFLSSTLTGAAAGAAGGFVYDQIQRR